jgi:Tfp pilus assembly protein PilO
VNEKKRLLISIAVAALVAIGLGTLIYFQHQTIEKRRLEVATLKKSIEEDRALLQKTPDLIKKVIIQRETDGVIKEILSDDQDINNLVRTLTAFAEESGFTFTSIKKQRDPKRNKDEFDRVGYALAFEADAFQLLAFLDKIETHKRFMSVTKLQLQAAGRKDYEDGELPRHRLTMDLETYVYAPTANAKEVRIDQYEKKRDLLVPDISKRTAELRVPTYEYRGQRARRDPWIDPRVPVDGGPTLPIEEQLALVDQLEEKAKAISDLWDEAKADDKSLIQILKLRTDLEERLALIEEEIRRIDAGGQLVFVPALRRFDKNVVAVVRGVREDMDAGEGAAGVSTALLRETSEAMERHIDVQEYELALQAFATVESALGVADQDPLKQPLVKGLRELKHVADTVLAFEAIDLEIGGVAIYEGRPPVVLVNAEALSEGDIIGDELIIHSIRADRIEFAFRGLVLARILESHSRP